MSGKLKVGVIFGGKSSETEVSLTGGRNVFNNLDKKLFEPLAIYWDKNFCFWLIPETLIIRNTTKEIEDRLGGLGQRIFYEQLAQTIDFAFLVTHGKFGDDGCLQGLFELLGIPYSGSGVLGASLGLDKGMQRKFMSAFGGINLPKYEVLSLADWQKNKKDWSDKFARDFGFPLVIKPTREGSTFGVCLVKKPDDLDSGFAKAGEYDHEFLVEPFLDGREFSCVVLGNDAPIAFLPTETIHQNEIFGYDEKYLPGASNKITPMEVEPDLIAEIQAQCVRAYKAIGAKNYARIDGFLVDGKVYITDPNSAASTGMGPSSWTFHQAIKAGYNIKDFLSKLIEVGKENFVNKKGPL